MYREALFTDGSRYIFIKPLSLFYKNTRTDGSVGSRLLLHSSLRVFWLEEVVCIKIVTLARWVQLVFDDNFSSVRVIFDRKSYREQKDYC